MDLYFILLCFIAVQSAICDNVSEQTELEADKARSAWNFGAHHPIKRSSYWNRPKNVAGPGSVIANRRSGTISAQYNLHRRKPSQKRRQYRPYPPQQYYQQNSQRQQPRYQNSGRSISSLPRTERMSQGRPRKGYRMRDPIRRRFMKEELWSLDKGEAYALKEEDLDRDVVYRHRHHEKNGIELEDIPPFHKQLATNAESMVNQAESNKTVNDQPPRIIHHHHYYEVKNPTAKPVQPPPSHVPTHAVAAPTPNHKMTQMPIPRIHNPIPLGCLLAVPVFHPIRPRHHLACLLSIPGTPNLSKRRRKRQAELPTITIMTPSAGHTQSVLEQLFSGQSKYTPMLRKAYSGHVGNGKNTGAPGPQHGNFKVPATIIAPPQFDKDDMLNMLLGSGGVSVDKLGSVVSTNNRYVRYGRGLPNSNKAAPAQSYRQGRQLTWDSPKPRPAPANNIQQILEGSGSNHMAAVAKSPPKYTQHGRNPVVHLTPPPPKKAIYTPTQQVAPKHPKSMPSKPLPPPQRFAPAPQQIKSSPTPTMIQKPSQTNAPIILNLQISPVVQAPHHDHDHHKEPTPAPVQQQPQPAPKVEKLEQEHPRFDFPHDEPIDIVTSSGKSHKLDAFKYTELVPVYLGKTKHNKPIKSYSPDTKDSKFYLRKLKSAASQDSLIADEPSQYYENPVEFQASPLIDSNSYPSTPDINYSYDRPSYSADIPASSWTQDRANQVTDSVSGKTLSFAVKNNFHDQLDSVLHEISSLEREASSKQYMYGNDGSDNVYASSSNIQYGPEKYYQVTRNQEQEPIFINVPQDMSNDLYGKKK